MKISKDEVKHLAELSNISLSDEDMESLRHDLANILGYIERLSELDTTGVDPTYQVSANQNTWREDEIDNYGVERDQLLALAGANQAENQIKVPKVL